MEDTVGLDVECYGKIYVIQWLT